MSSAAVRLVHRHARNRRRAAEWARARPERGRAATADGERRPRLAEIGPDAGDEADRSAELEIAHGQAALAARSRAFARHLASDGVAGAVDEAVAAVERAGRIDRAG